MFPLGHLAVGYLCHLGYRLGRDGSRGLPTVSVLLVLALGTQFPDLIDKPLAHWGVLVSGRSLGHSLLFALPLAAVVRRATRGTQRRELGTAFNVGVLSHVAADSYRALLTLDWRALGPLFYPVVPPVTYPLDEVSPVLRVVRFYADPTLGVETAVIVLTVGVVCWQVLQRR